MRLICKIFGHDWRYNFKWMPNKRICVRCKKKQTFNLVELYWTEESFIDVRTNEELIDKWLKNKFNDGR